MKGDLYFVLLILLITQTKCGNSSAEKDVYEENLFEKEKRIIDEYHKQVVISKGKENFFIPREEIGWYFSKGSFISVDDSKVGDNISFFDTLGNIQYQSIVVSIDEKRIMIKCQNLSNAEYYITELNIDSVKDLNSEYPYIVKAYRFE